LYRIQNNYALRQQKNMGNKIKHLELIQAIISRMASNLFFLRGWTVSLVAGLLALFMKDLDSSHTLVIYFPIIIFWILDGYFLSQERSFRALYNHVRILEEKDVDFSMDISEYKKDEKNGWICSTFSITLLIFYVPLIVAVILVTN
jgi:uncharacterized membrane protein